MSYILDFDYRNDNGPRRVGPFESRVAADAYADSLRHVGWEAVYCTVPVVAP